MTVICCRDGAAPVTQCTIIGGMQVGSVPPLTTCTAAAPIQGGALHCDAVIAHNYVTGTDFEGCPIGSLSRFQPSEFLGVFLATPQVSRCILAVSGSVFVCVRVCVYMCVYGRVDARKRSRVVGLSV